MSLMDCLDGDFSNCIIIKKKKQGQKIERKKERKEKERKERKRKERKERKNNKNNKSIIINIYLMYQYY